MHFELDAAIAEETRAAGEDPVTIQLNVAGAPFRCRDFLPTLRFIAVSASESVDLVRFLDAMRLMLNDDEITRFDECLDSDDAGLVIRPQAVMQAIPLLVSHYTGRNPTSSVPSASGPPDIGTESTQPAPVNID